MDTPHTRAKQPPSDRDTANEKTHANIEHLHAIEAHTKGSNPSRAQTPGAPLPDDESTSEFNGVVQNDHPYQLEISAQN